MFSAKVFLAALAMILAYFYNQHVVNDFLRSEDQCNLIIDAWQSTITKPERQFSSVAIGMNACVDLIVNGTALLELLNVTPGEKQDHTTLASLQDLQEAFHLYFSRGSAAERFFSDRLVFDNIITTAAQIPGAQWYVGGNAALMAQKMAATFPDLKIQLTGPVGPRLASLLHPHITVTPASVQSTDEVHLIMEYAAGAQWGDTRTPTATRFITSHDLSNAELSSLETFAASIQHTRPDLVVVSGLHMLDGQPQDLWTHRLQVLGNALRGIPAGNAVHLELASMADEKLLTAIISQIVPLVDSLGLNEQELSFVSQTLRGSHTDIFGGASQPQVSRVSGVLEWLLGTYGRGHLNQSRLTRVHFHSLTFHVLAVVPGFWDNMESSVAAGTRIASYQACDTDTLDDDLAEVRIPEIFKLHESIEEPVTFSTCSPVHQFEVGGFNFAFSPVLVCKKPLKTVGLGDAISATGLMYSSLVI